MRMTVENLDATIKILNVAYQKCETVLQRYNSHVDGLIEQRRQKYNNSFWIRASCLWSSKYYLYLESASFGRNVCKNHLSRLKGIIDKTITLSVETENTLILENDELILIHQYAFRDVEELFQERISNYCKGAFQLLYKGA